MVQIGLEEGILNAQPRANYREAREARHPSRDESMQVQHANQH